MNDEKDLKAPVLMDRKSINNENTSNETNTERPDQLSILFVDDDEPILSF